MLEVNVQYLTRRCLGSSYISKTEYRLEIAFSTPISKGIWTVMNLLEKFVIIIINLICPHISIDFLISPFWYFSILRSLSCRSNFWSGDFWIFHLLNNNWNWFRLVSRAFPASFLTEIRMKVHHMHVLYCLFKFIWDVCSSDDAFDW